MIFTNDDRRVLGLARLGTVSGSMAASEPTAGDLGLALSSLLRRYVEGASAALNDLPGGPRGFQVLVQASGDTRAGASCSNQATIAQRLGLDRTVMTYLVDDLERAGLVERRPDPADRRARQVVRTPSGDAALKSASASIRAVEVSVLGSLDADEALSFRRLLAVAVADDPVDHSACGGVQPDC